MERICGECRFFRVTEARSEGDIGKCRLEKVIGVFRDSMRACASFSRAGETQLPAPSSDRRRTVTRRVEVGSAPRSRVEAERLAEVMQTLDAKALKAVLGVVLQGMQALPVEELGRRWPGDLCLVPADESLQSKDVPLEQFFHKLVMVRDNLRVLEQKINSHATLHDAEKVDLQARVTRCHGAALALAGRWMPSRCRMASMKRRMGCCWRWWRRASGMGWCCRRRRWGIGGRAGGCGMAAMARRSRSRCGGFFSGWWCCVIG
jgi:hypothetical protein